MKTILLLLLSFNLSAQSIREGRWHINGVVITRTGNVQTEDSAGTIRRDSISWQNERRYTLHTQHGPLFVRVDRVTYFGYTGLVTDGRGRKRYFEAIKID